MEKMYSPTQAAKMLNKSRQVVNNYIQAGEIKPQRVGYQYVLTEQDLQVLKRMIKKPGRPKKEKVNK